MEAIAREHVAIIDVRMVCVENVSIVVLYHSVQARNAAKHLSPVKIIIVGHV